MIKGSKWHKTSDVSPPQNVMIEGTLSGGEVVEMMRRGNLFYPNGGNIYAYYSPIYWRLKQ